MIRPPPLPLGGTTSTTAVAARVLQAVEIPDTVVPDMHAVTHRIVRHGNPIPYVMVRELVFTQQIV